MRCCDVLIRGRTRNLEPGRLPALTTPPISAVALDLGTTAIKAGLLDGAGVLGGIVARPAPEMAADGGRYESDALVYAQTAERVLAECLAQIDGVLPPLGMCSQRSSFLIWERASGAPITPLISWQDTRGAASCEALQNSEVLIRELTGLRLTPYYFAPKLRVVLLQHPEWRAQLERGELLVGTLDTFLIWRWTGGRHYVTDASMAARTLLMDVHRQRWSPELCELFDIPPSILPEIKPSAGMNLALDKFYKIHNGIISSPLSRASAPPSPSRGEGETGLILQASMGDQSAALIASVGENSAEVLVNLGTGGFAMRYVEERSNNSQSAHPHLNPPPQRGGNPAPSPSRGNVGMGVESDGYLRTLVYQDARTHLAIEGTLNSLAAALAPYPAAECRSDDLGREEIFCLAEPSGLGAPYFRNDLGLYFSAAVDQLSSQQIAVLLLEGIIFRVARILEDFQRISPIVRIYLSGGLSELECLQQGIAQCAPCAVYRLRQKDASLQGAALLAAGMTAVQRDAAKVVVARGVQALPGKYQRWKIWFDALLKQS